MLRKEISKFSKILMQRKKNIQKKIFPCPYMMVYLSRFHVIFGQKFCQKIFNAFGRSKEIKIKLQLDKKKKGSIRRIEKRQERRERKERKKGGRKEGGNEGSKV